MREGYKDSEVGVIPVEWEIVKVKDFAEVATGNTPPTKDKNNYGLEYPWITPTDISDKKNIYEGERSLSLQGYEKARQLPKNTVLITSIASIGKNAILRVNGACNQQINAILPSNNHSEDYIYYWFENNTNKIIGLAGQTAVLMINKTDFSNITIPLPPLKEQEKIASILSTADEKIEAIAAQIEKHETLKTGLLQKLLSEGIGHTEFKESELGRLPVGWEVVKLGECISDMRGGAPFSPKDFTDNGHYVLHKGNVVYGGKLIQKDIKYTSYEYANRHKSNIVDNTFLITTLRDLVPSGPTIGLIVKTPRDNKYVLAQGAYGFRLNSQLNDMFIIQYSNTKVYRKLMQSIAVGSTQIHIRTPEFLGIDIPLPPLQEQKQIADILSTADEKLEVLRAKKEKFETLKKGLLQKLLSGELRTV